MANDAKNPMVGERVIDASECDYLRDVEPRALLGSLTAQDGLPDVLVEVDGNIAEWGTKAGMTAADVADLAQLNERIARIDVFLGPTQKLAEMLSETRYLLEDQRQRILLNLGAAVERRGREHPELLARYAKTRAYRSAAGKKAAKTRRKNAEQAQGQTPAPATDAPPQVG